MTCGNKWFSNTGNNAFINHELFVDERNVEEVERRWLLILKKTYRQ